MKRAFEIITGETLEIAKTPPLTTPPDVFSALFPTKLEFVIVKLLRGLFFSSTKVPDVTFLTEPAVVDVTPLK